MSLMLGELAASRRRTSAPAGITLGTTAPAGAGESGFGHNGDMYATAYVLSGAPAGAVFTKIRLRVKNRDTTTARKVRGVVYDNSNNLIDWGEATLAANAPDQIIEIPLTRAVVASNGSTYKIGIQGESTNLSFWVATSGVSPTTYYWNSGASYGAAPPNPWTPTGSVSAWQVAAEADVAGGVIGFRAVGTLASRASQNTTAMNPGLPAGTAAGDLMLLVATTYKSSGSSTIDVPSGWTQIDQSAAWATNYRSAVFWKIAGSSESAPSVTTAAACFLDAVIFSFTGCNATPIDAALTWTFATANPVVVDAITTATANAWRLVITCDSFQTPNSSSVPSGWTQRLLNATGGAIAGYVASSVLVPTAGAAAATSFLLPSASGGYVSIGLALKPA